VQKSSYYVAIGLNSCRSSDRWWPLLFVRAVETPCPVRHVQPIPSSPLSHPTGTGRRRYGRRRDAFRSRAPPLLFYDPASEAATGIRLTSSDSPDLPVAPISVQVSSQHKKRKQPPSKDSYARTDPEVSGPPQTPPLQTSQRTVPARERPTRRLSLLPDPLTFRIPPTPESDAGHPPDCAPACLSHSLPPMPPCRQTRCSSNASLLLVEDYYISSSESSNTSSDAREFTSEQRRPGNIACPFPSLLPFLEPYTSPLDAKARRCALEAAKRAQRGGIMGMHST
jgi:hypothetical protein